MKKIILLSPVPLTNPPSGISIRIEQLKSQFANLGLNAKIVEGYEQEKANYLYLIVSTKADSISTKVAREFDKDKKLIVDLYTPIFLEKEAYLSKWKPQDWLTRLKQRNVITQIMTSGNIFFVANGRQKQYWKEVSKSLGVRGKKVFTIPTGVPNIKTIKTKDLKVILWFGGIYPWMNPKPLVEAFAKIAPLNPQWKLRVLGGFHPKTGYQKLFQVVIEKAQKIIPLNQLEILPWQKERDLSKFLEDVAFAVHLPKTTREDYLAHRARLLTLLNSKIPVITSGKDLISEFIVKYQAGLWSPGTPKDLEEKLTYLMNNPAQVSKLERNTIQIQDLFLKSESEIERFSNFINRNVK